VKAFKGRLDVLINNASVFLPTPPGQTTKKQWDDIIGMNMMAPYFLAQAFRQQLQKHKGCIINLTDIYGVYPLERYSVYSAAKAGLIMLTHSLAGEMGPDIRVNAVSPGAILWPEDLSENGQQAVLEKTLLGRPGSPEDIANTVGFLIEKADYITGQVINVDGGRLS
jgi:pteridine reductase